MTHQLKYDFFLMAAAAAAIALAISDTRGLPLQWSFMPLGFAILLWLLSFFTGCLRQNRVSQKMRRNQKLFAIPKLVPESLRDQPAIQDTITKTLDEIK